MMIAKARYDILYCRNLENEAACDGLCIKKVIIIVLYYHCRSFRTLIRVEFMATYGSMGFKSSFELAAHVRRNLFGLGKARVAAATCRISTNNPR